MSRTRKLWLSCLVLFALPIAAPVSAQAISGSSSNGTPAVRATGTNNTVGVYSRSDTSYGIYGQSDSFTAIAGLSFAGQGSGEAGVVGSSDEAYGVYGSSNLSEGVYGDSFLGNGVTGTGGWNGVWGTTSSTNPLTGGVHGGTAGAGNGVFAENGGSGKGLYATSATGNAIFASSGTTDAIVGYAGTGAGSTGIWGKAHGSGTYGVYSSGDLYVKGVTGSPGNAYKPGGGSWTATSDARVKKDVTAFTSGLPEIERVHPVRFKYNGLGGTADTGKEYVGVIAQQLEPVLPFMVSSQKRKLRENDRETTDIKEVDPSAFTYALINAVQELSRQNKAEATERAELSRKLDALSVQNQALAAQVKQLGEVARLACREHPNDALCDARVAALHPTQASAGAQP